MSHSKLNLSTTKKSQHLWCDIFQTTFNIGNKFSKIVLDMTSFKTWHPPPSQYLLERFSKKSNKNMSSYIIIFGPNLHHQKKRCVLVVDKMYDVTMLPNPLSFSLVFSIHEVTGLQLIMCFCIYSRLYRPITYSSSWDKMYLFYNQIASLQRPARPHERTRDVWSLSAKAHLLIYREPSLLCLHEYSLCLQIVP